MRSVFERTIASCLLVLFCVSEAKGQGSSSGKTLDRFIVPRSQLGPLGPVERRNPFGPNSIPKELITQKEKEAMRRLGVVVKEERFKRGMERAWERYLDALGERIVPMVPDQDAIFVLKAARSTYNGVIPTEISADHSEAFPQVDDHKLLDYRKSREEFFVFWRARSKEIEMNLYKRKRLGACLAAVELLASRRESYLRYIGEHERLNNLPAPIPEPGETPEEHRLRLEKGIENKGAAGQARPRYVERKPDPDLDWYRDDKQETFLDFYFSSAASSQRQFRWRRDVPRECWPAAGLQDDLSVIALSFSHGRVAPVGEFFCHPEWSRTTVMKVPEQPMTATGYELLLASKSNPAPKAPYSLMQSPYASMPPGSEYDAIPPWPFGFLPLVYEKGDWMAEGFYDDLVKDSVRKDMVPDEWNKLALITAAIRIPERETHRTGCRADRLLAQGGPAYVVTYWAFETRFPNHAAMRESLEEFIAATGPLRADISDSIPPFDATVPNTAKVVTAARLELMEEARRMKVCAEDLEKKMQRHKEVTAYLERKSAEKAAVVTKLENARNAKHVSKVKLEAKTAAREKAAKELEEAMELVEALARKITGMKEPKPGDSDFVTAAEEYVKLSAQQSSMQERVSKRMDALREAGKLRASASEAYQKDVMSYITLNADVERIISEIILGTTEKELLEDFISVKQSEFKQVSVEHAADLATADRLQAQLDAQYPGWNR